MRILHYERLGPVPLASFLTDDFGDCFQVVAPGAEELVSFDRVTVPEDTANFVYLYAIMEEH